MGARWSAACKRAVTYRWQPMLPQHTGRWNTQFGATAGVVVLSAAQVRHQLLRTCSTRLPSRHPRTSKPLTLYACLTTPAYISACGVPVSHSTPPPPSTPQDMVRAAGWRWRPLDGAPPDDDQVGGLAVGRQTKGGGGAGSSGMGWEKRRVTTLVNHQKVLHGTVTGSCTDNGWNGVGPRRHVSELH